MNSFEAAVVEGALLQAPVIERESHEAEIVEGVEASAGVNES